MIPWWGWILIIAAGMIVAGIIGFFAYFILAGLLIGGLTVTGWIARLMYNHKRRVTNEKARKLRLQRDDWHGYPLPKGKSGELIITKEMLRELPAFSQFSLTKAYTDRARDLKVDFSWEFIPISQSIRIKWWPKNRKN